MADIQEENDSKMESFTKNDGAAADNQDSWEDPMTCCGCIPIKIGMYILTIGSYVIFIMTLGAGV